MAKWYGKIGYADLIEKEPGDWVEDITERSYFGEVYKNTRMLQSSGNVNDNVNISNQISIIADPYAKDHIYAMRYIEFQGAKWKITNVDVQYPRLTLSVGGLYNGEQA